MRRGVGHASASARGTEAAALAGEGHESLAGAGLAAHPHEAVSKNSAREKGPELALDETRHGSLAGSGVCEKAFEFGLHHAVEDALLGAAAGVDALARAVRRCASCVMRREFDTHARRATASAVPRERLRLDAARGP